ncbi:MAG: sugar phosphate nucleotidyltransferase [Bacteroidota bacterium]
MSSSELHQHPLAAVIMAAGQGKRMKNPDKAKVMHELAGLPLVGHVIRLAHALECERVVVVVGHQRESVIEFLQAHDASVEFAVQSQQLGTAHAVQMTEEALRGFEGDVVILSGDAPMTRVETLSAALLQHREREAAVTVLTALLPDPTGYGRVIRDDRGEVLKIVEHKDATEAERSVCEINSGIYIFDRRLLFDAMKNVGNDNAQGEYYLPDVIGIFQREARVMIPFVVEDADEIRGVNTLEQLQEMEQVYIRRESERP